MDEYCADGDLYTHLTSATRVGAMDEPTSIHVMTEILTGVAFMHCQLGIVHRDMSLEYVLLHDGDYLHDLRLPGVRRRPQSVRGIRRQKLLHGAGGRDGRHERPREGGYLVAGRHVLRPVRE
ncbi:hypothetical protein ON010_g11355 [Phytophthora cinnamomi]|nr:hypothetical protein ON010_g11355 [Phytophthora cinnamomi]